METSRSQIRIWAERLLLFAPLVIALIANVVTSRATSQRIAWWLYVLIILVAIITILLSVLVYTQTIGAYLDKCEQKRRAKRFRRPKVLILDGTLNGGQDERPPSPLHTNKAPLEWQTALREFGWNVQIGPIQDIGHSTTPDIVINPFGERYPEENFQSLLTASNIVKYVREGGVYVNVAGIPFWYCYDPRRGVADVAGRMERANDGTSNRKPLFHDLLPGLQTSGGDPQLIECRQTAIDLERFGDIANAGNVSSVVKFRAYPSSSGQMTPMLRESHQDFYIIGGVIVGHGCFLFAGVQIDDTSASFAKVVASIKGWAGFESRNRSP
jgi:hypothetical protein